MNNILIVTRSLTYFWNYRNWSWEEKMYCYRNVVFNDIIIKWQTFSFIYLNSRAVNLGSEMSIVVMCK